MGPGGGGGGSNSETLTYNDAEAISEGIDGLTAVLPQYSGNLQVRSDLDSYNASVLGATADYARVRNIEVSEGRYFTSAEYNNNARVAVLGSEAANELFAGLNPIGRNIRIDGKRFEVVGLLEQQDSSGFGNNPNLQVQVPLTTAYRILFDARATASTQNTVSSIVVAAENVDDVNTIIDDITQLLRERHRLDADEEDDFSILDQQQLLDAATTITSILTVLLGAIASVSLLVGGIGIMNIMLVSVTERTKEIGLRKAIGARRSHILQQFLIETIFLSLLGGLLGVLLGVGIALLVNGSGLLNATITLDSIALGLGFSAIVGIFFGVYPANQAASLEPIEALRYE
jgi:putative ABC transport system permease protein